MGAYRFKDRRGLTLVVIDERVAAEATVWGAAGGLGASDECGRSGN